MYIIPGFSHFLQSHQSIGNSPAAFATSGSVYDFPHHLFAFPTEGKGALHGGVGRSFFAISPEYMYWLWSTANGLRFFEYMVRTNFLPPIW